MTTIRFSIILFFSIQSISFWAQTLDTNIVLNPVKITTNKEIFLIVSKIEKLSSVSLKSLSSKSLDDAIERFFPVYLKSNAGGLATIRFRGTGPEHTAILFNGININSLTLGQSNISTIPLFIFDNLKVQYGSSASLYGTDAIGGSIQLENKPKWNKGFQLGLEQDFGSFHSFFSGVKAAFSTKKWIFQIKAYHGSKQNDFPFLNTAVKDFVTKKFVKDTCKNSAQNNFGLLQELNYRITNTLFAYSKIWYDDNNRQIQQNMSANYFGGDNAEIANKHLRAISGLKYYNGYTKYTMDLGYIHDYQKYNKNENQIISTNTFVSNLNYFNTNVWKGVFNFGMQFKHIIPDVYAYKADIKENRIDIFSSYKRPIFANLKTIVNLRESVVFGYKNNFAPSIGLNYLLELGDNKKLELKTSFSKSYKIPTFNQRYWYPNGNPDILPETGINYEIGTNLVSRSETGSFNLNITAYQMVVDNWIQWINLDIWRPVNLKQVKNTGIELSFKVKKSINAFVLQAGANYSFTNAREVKSYKNQNTFLKKQLIYTPKNIVKLYSDLTYKSWYLQTSLSFTGKRYTETYKVLDSYWLWNMDFYKKIEYGKSTFNLGIGIDNILNKSYQNWEFYAMPGRAFSLQLKVNFNE